MRIRCACGRQLDLPPAHIGKALVCQSCRSALRVVAPASRVGPKDPSGLLIIRAGPHRRGEQIFLAGDLPIQIGKLPGSDIRLQSNSVSRTHCRLVRSDSGWRIEDEASTNGVHVKGRRVASHELQHGDRVRIGDFQFKYLSVSDAAATAMPVADAGKPAKPKRRTAPPPQPEEDAYSVVEDHVDSLDDDEWAELASAGQKVETAIHESPIDDELDDAGLSSAGVGPPTDGGPGEGVVCPCCERILGPNARVCVACGIDVRSGRSILTAQDHNLDEVYVTAESLIRLISWVFWVGVYPIASEAFGTRKPYVVRALAIATIVISGWFLVHEWTMSPRMRELKNLMLWAGEGEPTAEEVFFFYDSTNYGDSEAFAEKCEELRWDNPDLSVDEVRLAAHKSLAREQQCQGQYRSSQLITHAFLHGGIVHLLGNLLFLMVFGSRVNALVGNLGTMVLYPVLAAGAALAHMSSVSDQAPAPMLGASGAIMGLAGMYFVFFPIHKVHMAAWTRWGLFAGFHLSLRLWSLRGFWVVLFYIAADVIYTARGIEDGTAHWAYLGGFIVGVVAALILLFARLVNCRGGDIVSAVLGRHAWALVGKPNRG